MNQASFKIRKSKLLNELKKITKALGPVSKWNRYATIELTITDGLLTLVIPGIRLELPCETTSTEKATLGLFYFRDIIKNWAALHLECFIQDEVFKIGVTSVRAQTTFFETDSILRSIKLPVRAELHSVPIPISNYSVNHYSLNPLVHAITNNEVPLALHDVLTAEFFLSK